MNLIRFFFLSIFLSASGQVLAESTLDGIKKNGKVRVAHRESSVPFSYYDDQKRPIGYSVDICLKIVDAIRKELKQEKLPIEWVPVTSATRIPTIEQGKADIECGSTTNNAERRQRVGFSIPIFFSMARMVVRTDSGINSWSDLRSKSVATTQGTTNIEMLKKVDYAQALNLNIKLAKDHSEAFSWVMQGQAIAFAMDDVLLAGLRAASPAPGLYSITGEPLSVEPYSLILKKDDEDFRKLVNRVIVDLINTGEFQRIYRKWFQSPIAPQGANLNLPMSNLLKGHLRWPTEQPPF
ncbi:MAG: amino acid ABC transporter substrate-binding protein [Burkholderiales bacterium]|jgi:glutamate/aspartate transport system substrate-binding protein|nr:amino acid ABC transporter substrate-binding protein [Burkholderiales bacterium]